MTSVLTISLFRHLQQENQHWTSRILIWRLQPDSGKSAHGTSRSKSPQTKEKFNMRSHHSRADRMLGWSATSSKLVATMKPSWTSQIHRKFNERKTTFRPSTQSRTKYCQQSLNRPTENIFESPYKMQIDKSEELKYWLPVYTQEATFDDKNTTIANWSSWPKDISSRKSKIHFKLRNRDEDRYQKRLRERKLHPLDHPKANVHSEKHAHSSTNKTRKAKVAMTEVLNAHQNLLGKVRPGMANRLLWTNFKKRSCPKRKTWNYWSVLEWSKFTAPGGCRLGDKCAYKHTAKLADGKKNSASIAFHIPSNERCNYEKFSRIQRPNTEWYFIMSRTSPFSRGKTWDLHFDPDWISESAGLWE